MKLDGLVALYKSMKEQYIDRYRFEYRHAKALFDIFFFIDEKPFILLFGAKGDAFSFDIEVESGFRINPVLDKEIYKELCRVLGIKYDPENPFSTRGFFNQFNQAIPRRAEADSIPQPQDIAAYRSIAEEEDKIYFLGWRDNEIRGENVSDTNLMKTKTLLGNKAYKRCDKKNISSCWTDDPNRAKELKLP